jgi:hypothetical protein
VQDLLTDSAPPAISSVDLMLPIVTAAGIFA